MTMKHNVVIFLYLTLTYLQETVKGSIQVAYFEIDHTFAIEGEYNMCPKVEFQITTCQNIAGQFESICKGPGGYQSDLTGPPTINDPDITICCSRHGSKDTETYLNATKFADYIDGREVGYLTTIGCDFSGEENRFLTFKKFKKFEAKTAAGTVQVEIDVNDSPTTNWIKDVTSTASGESDFVIDSKIFKYKKNSGNQLKSFSFINTSGTGKLQTVTYFGT